MSFYEFILQRKEIVKLLRISCVYHFTSERSKSMNLIVLSHSIPEISFLPFVIAILIAFKFFPAADADDDVLFYENDFIANS